MQIIAHNGPLGTKVTVNAWQIAPEHDLDESSGDLYLADTEGNAIGGEGTIEGLKVNDYLLIEEEAVKVTAIGSPCTITRAQPAVVGGANTVADSHEAGAFARQRTGTTVLEHTFNGSESVELLKVTAERMFWVAKDVDGEQGAPEPVGGLNGENLQWLDPFTSHQPDNETVLKLVVWSTLTRMFGAEIR